MRPGDPFPWLSIEARNGRHITLEICDVCHDAVYASCLAPEWHSPSALACGHGARPLDEPDREAIREAKVWLG